MWGALFACPKQIGAGIEKNPLIKGALMPRFYLNGETEKSGNIKKIQTNISKK